MNKPTIKHFDNILKSFLKESLKNDFTKQMNGEILLLANKLKKGYHLTFQSRKQKSYFRKKLATGNMLEIGYAMIKKDNNNWYLRLKINYIVNTEGFINKGIHKLMRKEVIILPNPKVTV